MNVPLVAAGAIALLGAAIHGGGGEVLVVRKLSAEMLPSTRFGGPRMTRAMIHVTWHMTTIAFVTVGCALIAAGAFLDGDAERGIAIVAACACTGFALLVLGLGGAALSPRLVFKHPAPAVLTAAAVLAWLGAL